MQGRVRDPRAGYAQSLGVLREAKACGVLTKSSIMLGLGETHDEIVDTLLDLRDAGEQYSICWLARALHMLHGCAFAAWLGQRDTAGPPAPTCAREVAQSEAETLCAGVDIVTFGQYLQPTPQHLPVKEFVTPEQFEDWRRYGEEEIGFR